MIDSLPFWIWWLLGMIMGAGIVYIICSHRKDGVIHVLIGEEKDNYLFEFNIPPEEIPTMNQVVFAVKLKHRDRDYEESDSQNLQST